MNRAAALFEKLSDVDVEWLLSAGLENQLAKGEAVIRAGQPVGAVHLVRRGLLGVFAADGEERLAVVGPGGVVGEMSLLEERPPTESVAALEPTAVLTVPHATLEARFGRDPQFAARFYRGLAKLLSQRLRRANGQLAAQQPDGEGEVRRRVAEAVGALEEAVHAANEAAQRGRDAVPDAEAEALREAFARFCAALNRALGASAPGSDDEKEQAGLYAQRQLLPYLLLTRAAERAYAKPRGYPGDFMLLEMIYQNAPRGTGRVGPVLDRCFLESPLAAGVRGRRAVLAAEIARAAAESGGEARVAALGCGPAAEVFDALADGGAGVRATLVDFDPQALALVAERRDRLKLRDRIELVEEDAVRLAGGRMAAELRGQDLVYVPVLLEAMDGDEPAVRLLSLAHGMLRPGGRVVVCAAHPGNPCRACMDHVLDWRLAHRDEDALYRLFAASAFGRPADAARLEPAGVFVVAECTRSNPESQVLSPES
ncbi:MAG TPA: cyclic nucleotide-binding domain-containing protein [Longimicrobiaceae bacterium]|nr:cyclic nucleotide-binding domain-containing protein [Longimicrobiaceae bacterium]